MMDLLLLGGGLATSLPPEGRKIVVKKEDKEKEVFELKTPGGYLLDEVRSAIQKALRRGQEEEAAYWSMEMIEGGFWKYWLRTLECCVIEDVGLANPEAIVVTEAVKEAIEFKKEKKGLVPTEMIGFIILYLARQKHNREGDDFIEYIQAKRKQGWRLVVPEVALDSHCERGRKRLKEAGIDPTEEFYFRGSKLKNEVVIKGNRYRDKILEVYGLSERE